MAKMPDLVIEQKPSLRLWVLASLGALALHIGCAGLVIAPLQTDDPDDSLGAPAIEIGLEMMAPRQEVTDLPPGPDTDASVASPALAEQQAEVKETDLPKDIPTDEAEADRMVTPNDVKEPIEGPEKVANGRTPTSR